MIEIKKTTGMRFRMHLGSGEVEEGKEKGEKFYISYDSEGVIIEVKESNRDYYVIPFNSLVQAVFEKRIEERKTLPKKKL